MNTLGKICKGSPYTTYQNKLHTSKIITMKKRGEGRKRRRQRRRRRREKRKRQAKERGREWKRKKLENGNGFYLSYL